MAKLSDKAENALNETRMLILGSQVLLGFEFQAAFQPGFDRLPASAQQLAAVGFLVMLLAVGLLIAPCAFHQIVERGNDTPRLIEFTGRIASAALLPFAFAIGVELYVASINVLSPGLAVAAALAGAVVALAFWYGLEWAWRERKRRAGDERKEEFVDGETSLETRIKHVLTEARVVLPGVQALLGFQLAATLTDAFAKLPKPMQELHLVILGLLALTIVLLMAPAAFHRIVERGEDTELVHRFSSVMVLASMVPLALAIAGDLYIVLARVLESSSVALVLAAASLVFFFALWFGLTLVIRARLHGSRGALSVSRAVR
jgi:hypothetical protein